MSVLITKNPSLLSCLLSLSSRVLVFEKAIAMARPIIENTLNKPRKAYFCDLFNKKGEDVGSVEIKKGAYDKGLTMMRRRK